MIGKAQSGSSLLQRLDGTSLHFVRLHAGDMAQFVDVPEAHGLICSFKTTHRRERLPRRKVRTRVLIAAKKNNKMPKAVQSCAEAAVSVPKICRIPENDLKWLHRLHRICQSLLVTRLQTNKWALSWHLPAEFETPQDAKGQHSR